jgi:hypothetical protein
MKYVNGEKVTKERIQDESWYPEYQAMLHLKVFGGPNGHIMTWQELVKAFLDDWGIGLKAKIRPRLETWAKCCMRPEGGCMRIEKE